MTDETRLDLRAADQERLEQWRNADRLDAAHLALQSGAALYPMVGRRGGRLYGTPRQPPAELGEARDKDQDERMTVTTYREALERAIYHASSIPQEQFYSESQRASTQAHAAASQAWSALAGLLRADETRAAGEEYGRMLREELKAQGLSPTGRKRDYVHVPSPEAQQLLDEAAQVRGPALQNIPDSPAANLERAIAEGKI